MSEEKILLRKARTFYEAKDHTFVICAYRKSPYLEQCIKSVLSQEVLGKICIATSTPNDYISDLAGKYKIDLFINSNNAKTGIAEDWNYAVECAKTPLVTLAHQDDIYENNYLQEILQALNSNKYPLIAFTDYRELRNGRTVANNKLLKVKRLMLSPLKIKMLENSRFVRRFILSMGSAICCPSVTLVKEHISLPVFLNNMKSNIDWQAWESISRKKGGFVYVSKKLVEHRIHQQSTTSELLAVNGRRQEDLYMFQKFWPGWIARGIEAIYNSNEKSNIIK